MSTKGVIDLRTPEEVQDHKEFIHIRVAEFQSSGILITFPVSTKNMGDNFLATSDIREGLLKVFKENHIEIPYQKVQIIK